MRLELRPRSVLADGAGGGEAVELVEGRGAVLWGFRIVEGRVSRGRSGCARRLVRGAGAAAGDRRGAGACSDADTPAAGESRSSSIAV